MILDLCRTFSEHSKVTTDSDDQDWSLFLGPSQGRITWEDLHKKPLVIVLGEAGIGKTIEFRCEARKLREAGQAAFFISLNQLTDVDSWRLVLTGFEAEFDAWAASNELGFFFLDAVDEARLKSHSDFERALAVVQRVLGPCFSRVRIAISSRVTDWSIPRVQTEVEARLAKPIAHAVAIKVTTEVSPTLTAPPTIAFPVIDISPSEVAYVVGLDPLSNSEARRCAVAFDLQDVEQFWIAVADGDYEFMATRPLDLRWMVGLWNQRRSLGTYRELIEANISNRLCEFNESYEAAGEVLSVDQLRAGATELAAAAEFGDCAFFTLDVSEIPAVGELDPHTVLSNWQPTAIRRLLATAVFDEASFGRVKFHHRSIREFLAAQWVAKQLRLGVPLQRLQGLFAGDVFGCSVLIPARRASLSWLAAIDVTAREWVVRSFPEILLFEGDPQAWDQISADQAFTNFINATKQGLQVRWFKSGSECTRVGRVLGVGMVAGALADASLPPQIRSMCFHIAEYAKLTDCAEVLFTIYRNTTASTWERALALGALEFVGTLDQRQEVLLDLSSGLLGTNELIASALSVTEWKSLTNVELSAILARTHEEAEFGSGPMARVFKKELLPKSDLAVAVLLLEAVMACLQRSVPGSGFAPLEATEQHEKGWLLYVLPHCYERVLALQPKDVGSYAPVCMEAAGRIETLYVSGVSDGDVFNRVGKAIEQHSELRWTIARAIAQSEQIQMSVNRLVWGGSCLVHFNPVDLPELTQRANDRNTPVDERGIWFSVAVAVAFTLRNRRERAEKLRMLDLDGAGSTRYVQVENEYKGFRRAAKLRRSWKAKKQEGEAAYAQATEDFKLRVLTDLAGIRDGTNEGLLRGLLRYSFERLDQHNYSDVDFEAISTSLSPETALALEDGLRVYWPTVTPPLPSAYNGGTVPWIAAIALAGLKKSLCDASAISILSATNVAKAAQLAVWELHSPPIWFETLARAHRDVVLAALTPWVVADVQAVSPNTERCTLEMVLRCTPDVRRVLLSPLLPLVTSGQINQLEVLKTVVIAMKEDGLLHTETVENLCRNRLTDSVGPDGYLGEMAWIRIWIESDAGTAWSWFQVHVQSIAVEVEREVNAFAKVVQDLKWLPAPLTQEAADVLLGIYALLSAQPPMVLIPNEDCESRLWGTPSQRLLKAIPNVFLGARGKVGHDSLAALLDILNDPAEQNSVRSRMAEHAALDVAHAISWTPDKLKSVGSPFLSPPCTEEQLYEQVIIRLEDIRRSLEEGPFSERCLFSAAMPEKSLQLWLAAKFRETQNRQFSVHREEEVDDDKKTDIQLSCPAGNVCVEIKPVDASRAYSANSLTETLRNQIVGQYLKGYNSSRGILVLMQLDNKTWSIPGGSTGQPFAALVDYLQAQAESISRSSSGVNQLAVFGIRCVV